MILHSKLDFIQDTGVMVFAELPVVFRYERGEKMNYMDKMSTPVSYTHLDVYKRQVCDGRAAQ